jgi:hypothetical protein
MYQFIYSETRKARKQYDCNSCEHLFEVDQRDALWALDGAAKERYLELLSKDGKINAGDFYVYEVYKFDGKICVSRYLPVAHALCQKLDCYPRY